MRSKSQSPLDSEAKAKSFSVLKTKQAINEIGDEFKTIYFVWHKFKTILNVHRRDKSTAVFLLLLVGQIAYNKTLDHWNILDQDQLICCTSTLYIRISVMCNRKIKLKHCSTCSTGQIQTEQTCSAPLKQNRPWDYMNTSRFKIYSRF